MANVERWGARLDTWIRHRSLIVVDGALVDEFGKTVAVVEMSPSIACPDDFLANISLVADNPMEKFVELSESTNSDVAPEVLGDWSDYELSSLLT